LQKELLTLVAKDEVRSRALEEILSSIIATYRESPQLDRKIEGYFSLASSLLKRVFEEELRVKVKDVDYPLSLKSKERDELLEIFNTKVKGKWILAVDESQHSGELFLNQSYFFRGSLAYGLKISGSERGKEKILAILSSFKVSEETSTLKDKLDLQTYIQNLLVAFYSLLILKSKGEEVYALFLDGPLIRELHHFLFITFSYKELKEMFMLDPELEKELVGEEWIERGFKSDLLGREITVKSLANGEFLDLILSSPVYEEILERLQGGGEEERRLRSTFDYYGGWERVKNRELVPGIILYFLLLRLISDFVRENEILFVGVVKASHRSKEFLRFYYAKAFTKLAEKNARFRYDLYMTGLFSVSELRKFSERLKKGEITKVLLEDMNLTDDHLIAFCLDFDVGRANFTSPFEIRRYRSKRSNRKEVFDVERDFKVGALPYGSATTEEQTFWLEDILLDVILPPDSYKFYMLYVRTSEVRFPLRVEFPIANIKRAEEIASVVYLLSAVYRNYGIPIVLKYVDFLVRVSTRMIHRLSRGLLRDKYLEKLIGMVKSSYPDSQEIIKMLMFEFKRDFYSR